MGLGLIGKKIGMSQIFDEHGNVVPVTVIKAGPCYVVRRRPPIRKVTTPSRSVLMKSSRCSASTSPRRAISRKPM